MNDLAAFSRLLEALAPWRAQIVLAGGWAHRIHRLHPLAGAPSYQPLLTRDMDIAFADRPPLKGDIKSALLEAGSPSPSPLRRQGSILTLSWVSRRHNAPGKRIRD